MLLRSVRCYIRAVERQAAVVGKRHPWRRVVPILPAGFAIWTAIPDKRQTERGSKAQPVWIVCKGRLVIGQAKLFD
jgi:hypothetical protein